MVNTFGVDGQLLNPLVKAQAEAPHEESSQQPKR
jgi:hypothetical protein